MALYDTIGRGYSRHRRPDPRIAAAINAALEGVDSIVNVGAGAGSYEPRGKRVLAVEPSEVMIHQRMEGAAPCVQGSAESLPIESASFDAAMAILSAHHWTNLDRGLAEMARVATKRIVLLTWVPDAARFWLTDIYFPEILAHDRTIFPTEAVLAEKLERIAGPTQVTPVPIPHDCIDGMLCAYWRRPELYLESDRREAISSFGRIDADAGLDRLRADLSSGTWAEQNGHLLSQESLDLGYRMVRSDLGERRT